MKIAWAVPRFENPRTGGEKVFERLAGLFRSKGVEIMDVYSKPKSRSGIIAKIINNYKNYRKLKSKGEEIPIIQNLFNRPEYFLANLFLRYFQKRHIVLFVHETYESEDLSKIKKLYHRFINHITFRTAIRIVVNSKYTGSWVCQSGNFREKLHVLYPVINVGDNSSNIRRKKFSQTINILCVGNIRRNKGQIYLLRALKDLPEYALVTFAGMVKEPEYMDMLRHFIRDNDIESRVRFAGFLIDSDLSDEYRNADLFALPTLKEGFGMAVHEAMSYGLPVVASDVGALDEIVEDGVSGLLVQPKDSHAIAKSICRIIDDPEYGTQLEKNALKHLAQLNTIDKQFDDFYNIIKSGGRSW